MISALKAKKMLRKGCTGLIAHVVEMQKEKLKPEEVPVVNEFLNLFPDDLLRLSPNRELEFTIKLLPTTTSISQYHTK